MNYPNGIKKKFKASASNRGMTLENEINESNTYYRDNNIAVIYKKPQYIIVPTLSFFIGVGGYSLAIRNFKTEQVEMPTIVTARIYQTQSPSDGRMLTYADSVYFNGEAFDGNILIYVYDNSNLFSDIVIAI